LAAGTSPGVVGTRGIGLDRRSATAVSDYKYPEQLLQGCIMQNVFKLCSVAVFLCGCASSAPVSNTPAVDNGPVAAGQPIQNKNFFAAITPKMTPEQVMDVLGAPGLITSGQSGKQWIPFYYGSDATRVYWSYKGIGLVVFSKNRYNGNMAVVETRYDASAL
jgi:hypothetical protein